MRDLVIVGVGGHGREILQCVTDINKCEPRWNVLGFVDDDCEWAQVSGMPVLGTRSWLKDRDCSVVVAIGSAAVRRRVVEGLALIGVSQFATLIHPSAQIGESVRIGEGAMICAGTILTTHIEVGRHVIVNTGAVISHDCELSDFATVAPRACLCGAVRLGEGAELGAACTVLPGVEIGTWASVGAAAAVVSNVAGGDRVVGVPARSIGARTHG